MQNTTNNIVTSSNTIRGIAAACPWKSKATRCWFTVHGFTGTRINYASDVMQCNVSLPSILFTTGIENCLCW